MLCPKKRDCSHSCSEVTSNAASMRPGFAGIDNELYANPKTAMLFGDAKDSVAKLIQAVKTV